MKFNLPDPRAVEIAGLCGFDAAWFCNEHVPGDWLALENQIRAARVHDVDSIVRVSRGSYSDYVRPLEAGATGIMVPHVATAEDARQVVQNARFHPLGKRALDGGNVDGHFCMLPVDEYLRTSNAECIIILQIESPEALENLDRIAAVPGFDGLLFGAGDFCHRIGKAGLLDAPETVAARQQVGRAARKHGKFAMVAGLIAPFPELVDEGYRVFNLGADVLGLGTYFSQRLAVMKGLVEALPSQRPAAARS